MNFSDYNKEKYLNDCKAFGVATVWHEILKNYDSIKSDFINIQNFSFLYEMALSLNEIDKKENGKFYTPKDTSILVAELFMDCDGYNICDVACGTGNLILNYFETIGFDETIKILSSGRLYLYDFDETALNICKYSIGLLYGLEYIEKINCVCGDFLDKKITLPDNCKVISNPPYFNIKQFRDEWEITPALKQGKELYVAFMEKIIKNSNSSVLLTPWTFLGADKFFNFRKFLNDYSSTCYCFDNVPCGLFNNKLLDKENSNKPNLVRASITVVSSGKKGLRTTPLIRFTADERSDVINKKFIMSLINDNFQIISDANKKYYKCTKELLPLFLEWTSFSAHTFGELISNDETEYVLTVPSMCRYFMSACSKDLNRTGKYIFKIKDYKSYIYSYALFNSSFVYWYWRLFDGGVNFHKSLMLSIPVFIDKINNDDFKAIETIVLEMMDKEKDFIVKKKNAGQVQENLKFSEEYRNKLNNILCKTLSRKQYNFNQIHKNVAL